MSEDRQLANSDSQTDYPRRASVADPKDNNNQNELPNIVILVPDEMRGDTVNNPVVQTPNIDSIADDGVIFTNTFAVNPVCAPSRCCTFTGLYPHTGGFRSLYQLLRPHDENVFKMLKNKGYEVVWIGRNDLFTRKAGEESVSRRIRPVNNRVREIYRTARETSLDLEEAIAPYVKVNPYPIGHPWRKSFYYGERTQQQAGYDFDQGVMQEGLNYLDEYSESKRDKPFCLYLAFGFPHPPYTVEEPYFSMYDRTKIPSPFPPESGGDVNLEDKPEFMKLMRERYGLENLKEEDFREIRAVYYGMISRLDTQIGQILDKLKEIGAYDSTAVTLFADHGDYAGSYGLTEKWSSAMHDCLLHVPLIVRIPGMKPLQRICDQLTQTIDLFPTLLEIARIETPYTHFGKSLIPAMKGEVETHRDVVFAEGGYNQREPQAFEDAVASPEAPMIGIYYDKTNIPVDKPETVCRAAMIRSKDWKLVIRSAPGTKEELYHLREDPDELVNLIDRPEYEEKIKELKEKLLYWYLETSDNPHWEHLREP